MSNESNARAQSNGNGSGPASPDEGTPRFVAGDLLPFVNALMRRWPWLVIGAVALALAGWWSGRSIWKSTYTASAQLLRQNSGRVTDVLGDRELDPTTYATLLRAPELLQRVAVQATPPLPVEVLARTLNITPERNSDILLITLTAGDRQGAVDLANLYARAAAKFTQELQTNAVARVSFFLNEQLAPLEAEITALNNMPQLVPRAVAAPPLDARPAFLEKLQAARVELADLQARYSEVYPLVQKQRTKIAALESQFQEIPPPPPMSAAASNAANALPPTQEHDSAFIHAKLQTLENARLTLMGQKQAALSLAMNPPGTCRVLAPATFKDAVPHTRKVKLAVLTGLGGLLGILAAMAAILLAEAVDPRLKTAADVRRVTGLPVVASAHNLARMTDAEQKNWAFRAWTGLQGLLSPSPNQGFVCGITSSESGEGRSTWIRLLADAASQRGFRVLTIIARPPEPDGKARITNGPVASDATDLETENPHLEDGALVPGYQLTTPDEVTRKLIGPNPEPVVQIPLPGWVWNLERRKQWHAALRHWSQIDNIALLVELPPASLPETVLLAENLPNLIWLADATKAKAGETLEQLTTLRNARCNLAGAVLNRAPSALLTHRLARWFS